MVEGVSAFQAGDHERARVLLEQAAAAGLESSALRYNLGVVYYRLKLYQQAREQFSALLDTSHGALARYNLGLVAKAEGRADEARAHFREVAEAADKDKLRQLARLQLDEPAPVEPAPWLGFAALGGGYEDNLSLLPETAASDLSDGFGEAILAGQGPLLTLAADTESVQSLDLSASLYRRQYANEDEFNNDAAQLGLAWTSERRDGRRQMRLKQSYFRIGDESREFHTTLELSARQHGCWADSRGSRCDLALAVSRVTPFDGFEPYEGMRYQALAAYRTRWQDWQPRLQLRLELNDREDLTAGEQFISVSPRRQEVLADMSYLGFGRLTLGAELVYRYSDYPEPYVLASSSGRESGRRVDQRYLAGVEANLALSAAWSVTAEASYRKNHSSLSQFSYGNQVTQVSLDYLF